MNDSLAPVDPFEKWLEQYFGKLTAFAKTIDAVHGEDLMNEALSELVGKAPVINDPDQFFTFVTTKIRQRRADFYRHKAALKNDGEGRVKKKETSEETPKPTAMAMSSLMALKRKIPKSPELIQAIDQVLGSRNLIERRISDLERHEQKRTLFDLWNRFIGGDVTASRPLASLGFALVRPRLETTFKDEILKDGNGAWVLPLELEELLLKRFRGHLFEMDSGLDGDMVLASLTALADDVCREFFVGDLSIPVEPGFSSEDSELLLLDLARYLRELRGKQRTHVRVFLVKLLYDLTTIDTSHVLELSEDQVEYALKCAKALFLEELG